MKTLLILNRAIANARPGGSLQDKQRRAMFARLAGGAGGRASPFPKSSGGARMTMSGQMAVPAAEALRRARALQAEAQARARVAAGTASPSEYEDVTGQKWQPRLAVPYAPRTPTPYGDDALIMRPMQGAPVPRASTAPPMDVRHDRTLLVGLGAALATVRGTNTVIAQHTRNRALANRLPPTSDPQERRRRAFWAKMKPGTGARTVSSDGMQSMELRALPQTYIPRPGGDWELITMRPPGSQPALDPQTAARALQGVANILENYRKAFPSDSNGYPTPLVHALEPYFDDPERLRNDPARLAQIEQQFLREIASYTTDNGQRIPPRGYYASMALTHALNLLHSFGRMRQVSGFSRRDGYGSYFGFSANPYDRDQLPYRGLPIPFPSPPMRPGSGAVLSPITKPGTPPSGPSPIPRPPARGGPYQPPGPPAAFPPSYPRPL